jgi:hypothetical protein
VPAASRQRTIGLILIALLILIFTIVRFARVIHWSVR